MIGPDWAGEGRPERSGARAACGRRIAVVTGSRADFGLLRSVMQAIEAREGLELRVLAAGAHLLDSGRTLRDVRAAFDVGELVPMQRQGRTTRVDDAEAVGRGIEKFARALARLDPAWVVVLGDRIEAFAAAAGASIGGWAVAHIHGGDRAEGVADEAMRHAITKLSHLHLAATEGSAERIRRMGERAEDVHVVGSPAIDGLDAIEPLGETRWRELGLPTALLLLHPIGRSEEWEEHAAAVALEALEGERVLALGPNHDPGRGGIVRAIEGAGVPTCAHLPRGAFLGLLRRMSGEGGVLVGNSSAALIEAAALRLPAVDIGSRQGGRERPGSVVHTEGRTPREVRAAIERARSLDLSGLLHPYGDGRAGERIAALLADERLPRSGMLRKRCVY